MYMVSELVATPSLSLKFFPQERLNISMKPSVTSPDRCPSLPDHYSNFNVSVVTLILYYHYLLSSHILNHQLLQGKDHVLFIFVSDTRAYHTGDVQITVRANIYRAFIKWKTFYK